MPRRAALLSLCFLLLPLAASAAFTSGNNARTLTHDTLLRSYNVYAPNSYDGASPVPLVVDLHGAGSTAAQQQFISGWQQKANQVGFLVAYPDGTDNTWNAGVCCGGAVTNNVDDVGFIRAMLTAIGAEGNIDTAQVYVTGLSNGGAMTHRLACEASDVFAAAAPAAFPTPYVDFPTECTPASTMPVLLFMGLTDIVVPYSGGTFGGAVASFGAWRDKNSCGPEPSEENPTFGGSYCEVDTSCGSSTQVGLCSLRGSVFDPPLDIFNGHILYTNDDDVSIADLSWKFFQTGSLKNPSSAIPSLGPGGLALLAGLLLASALGARRR